MNWWKGLSPKVKLGEPLKDKASFKIGGRAGYFSEPRDLEELRGLLISAKKSRLPVLILGVGSNILAGDKALKALVLRLNSPFFRKITFAGLRLEAGSGAGLGRLVQEAKEHGLSGIEFLAGIPGTLGGALIMNAGAFGREIADSVEKATVMDYNGRIKQLRRKEIKFSYRHSSLDKFVILSASLKLKKKKKDSIEQELNRNLGYRLRHQDYSFPNAGCIFKNPAGESAGKLIDLCGLKGKRIGAACISNKHANFILNLGNAKSADVLKLISLAQRRVKDKFKVNLEPEIKIWQ